MMGTARTTGWGSRRFVRLFAPGLAGGVLISLLWSGAAFVWAQDQRGDTPTFHVTDPKYATMIVARVGPISITAQQFLLSYEFGPAFAKRQKNSRQKYLEFMINEKLLALDAADRGARSSPQVRRSVAEIEGDLATEELYRDDILSKVRISDPELTAAMAEQRVHYSLRWLYAPTKEEIDSLRETLARGVPYESLYRMQLASFAGTDLRSWETTRFQLRNQRPAIAAAVDTLKPSVPSPPIEGPDGWYIMMLRDITFDAIVTDADAVKERYDAQRALTQRKADTLSDAYVNGIMSEHAPVIEPKTFGLLVAYLTQLWVPADRRMSWDLGRSLDHEMLLAAIADIDRFGDQPLVRMKDSDVLLKRFLSWYRARDQILKLRTTSLFAFESSLQGLVWRMVRDGLLIDRATARGFQKRESVSTQKKWWEEKVLYTLEKNALSDSMRADEWLLRGYYKEHLRSYRTPKGDTMTFALARDEVKKDWSSAELTRRLLHRIIALKRKYPVEIRNDALMGLPVENESDPRAVDVYVAKTGGTFPHPAFPTIDFDWQRWSR
jgi:hypothetical protein